MTREDWIAAARSVLEKRGIANVKIDRLSKQMKVTRGSFYFHFTGLKDLHESLLEDWRTCNCRPFEALANPGELRGRNYFDAIASIWVKEDPFSPRLDLAIREWSKSAKPIAKEMHLADDLRLRLLQQSFIEMGYDEDESLVRARITYMHQIGYYAMQFRESIAERKRYQPLYGQLLVGPRGIEAP